MVHKGDLCPFEEGVAPYIFHCLVVHKEHAEYGHFFPGRITTSIQKWCTSTHIFLWLITNMEMKVYNVHSVSKEMQLFFVYFFW